MLSIATNTTYFVRADPLAANHAVGFFGFNENQLNTRRVKVCIVELLEYLATGSDCLQHQISLVDGSNHFDNEGAVTNRNGNVLADVQHFLHHLRRKKL